MRYHTLREVSDIFRVRIETLYFWINEGKHLDRAVLKKTPGGRYLVPDSEVKRLLEDVF